MTGEKSFYERYWQDGHIKMNPFDHQPGEWTQENFAFHMQYFRPYMKGAFLDLGCGDGQFLNLVAPSCTSCAGVDVSETVIAKARTRFPSLGFDVLKGPIPHPDASFDTVSCIDVLEHILDIETMLEDVRRVLRPGGHFLIATSEFTRLKMFLICLVSFHQFFYPTTPHIRYFTRWNLEDILKRKGFSVVLYAKNRTYLGFIPQGQIVVARRE